MRERSRRSTQTAVFRRRLKWGVVFCAAAIVTAWFGMSKYAAQHRMNLKEPAAPTESDHSYETSIPIFDHGRRTLLLIGTDARPGDPVGNADVLMLCSLDQENRRIELLSIPRDTKILYRNGTSGKINALMQQGGVQELVRTVSTLLETPIDDYLVIRFPGVVDVVNALGGVELDVPKRMYTRTGDKQYGLIDLQPGRQRLNGEQALAFVRFRHDALGDIGRTERQQQFIRAVLSEASRPQNVIRLPSVVQTTYRAFDTDISLLEGVQLAAAAKTFSTYPVVSGTLPGSFHDPNSNLSGDASYWIINQDQARHAAADLLQRGIAVTNPVQDLSITAHWQPSTIATATNDPDTHSRHTD